MANFDLIAFDLDGTVFAEPHNEDIRPRVVRAFEAAHRAGVRISVASGRPVNMLGQTLMSAPWVDWLITVNGASVSSARDGAMVKARMMPRDQVREIVSVVRSIGDGAGKGGWSLFAPNRTCFDAALNEMFSAEMPEEPERENFSFVESVADRWGSVEEVSTVDAALDSLSTDVFKIGCMFASPEELGAARQAVLCAGHSVPRAGHRRVTRRGVRRFRQRRDLRAKCLHLRGHGQRRSAHQGNRRRPVPFGEGRWRRRLARGASLGPGPLGHSARTASRSVSFMQRFVCSAGLRV